MIIDFKIWFRIFWRKGIVYINYIKYKDVICVVIWKFYILRFVDVLKSIFKGFLSVCGT